MIICFYYNYIEQKFKYIFFDTDEYKKYYFYHCYCDLAFFLIEIDRININCEKLDKKFLEAEVKTFRFYCQQNLFFCYLRKLGDREAQNIENIQKIEKKVEFRRSIDPGFSISDNFFFIIFETDRALAAISEK